MKKLFSYILTAILFCGIGVAAGTQFLAKDVSFTPSKENQDKGWEVNNVEDALNDLYSNKVLKYYDSAYGGAVGISAVDTTTITQSLEKGDYYLIAIKTSADTNGAAFALNELPTDLVSISGCVNLETVITSIYGEYQNTASNYTHANQKFFMYKFTMAQDGILTFNYTRNNDRNIVLHFFKA